MNNDREMQKTKRDLLPLTSRYQLIQEIAQIMADNQIDGMTTDQGRPHADFGLICQAIVLNGQCWVYEDDLLWTQILSKLPSTHDVFLFVHAEN